jgi:hypothetical protein
MKGGAQKLPQIFLRLSKPTDMAIHWKDLEEHFLMVSLVFQFNHEMPTTVKLKIKYPDFNRKKTTWDRRFN